MLRLSCCISYKQGHSHNNGGFSLDLRVCIDCGEFCPNCLQLRFFNSENNLVGVLTRKFFLNTPVVITQALTSYMYEVLGKTYCSRPDTSSEVRRE